MRGSPWSELTGDEVVSPIGFALLVPYSAVSMFLANPDLRGTSGALRLLVAVLAQLVLYAVLASWLIATRRWPALSAGPLRVISAFVLASAIRAILVAQAIETMGLSNSIDWARRLPGSVLGFTVALSVIDIVLRSLRQHRTRVEQLEARQQAARLACDRARGPFDRQVSQRSRTDMLSDLVYRHSRSSEFAFRSHIDAIETRKLDWWRRYANVDLFRARFE